MKSKFSKKIFADKEAYYMSCPEAVAKHLAQQLSRYDSVVELCCAVGITAIQIAKYVDSVYAVDVDSSRISDAIKNAEIYGVDKKISFITGNAIDPNLLKKLSADVVVLDPDWSSFGEEKDVHTARLDDTQPNLRKMFDLSKRNISSNIIIRIPNTFTFETLSELGSCKIDNIIWGNKTRFKIAYFSDNININSEKDFYFD